MRYGFDPVQALEKKDKRRGDMKLSLSVKAIVLGLLVCAMPLHAQTVFTESGDQDWGNASNWSAGEPTGAIDAVIGPLQTAVASGGVADAYTGTLEIGSNAMLQVAQATDANAFGGGAITLHEGAELVLLSNSQYSFATIPTPLSLAGNATLSSAFNQTHRLYGGVSGAGLLTVKGAAYWFQNNNSAWTGGLVVAAGAAVRTYTGGSLGSGDVSVIENSQLEINTANVIDDSATVILSGGPWTAGGFKLSMASSDTVGGLQMIATNSMSLITGAGTLTVNGPISAEIRTGASATNTATLGGSGALTKTGNGAVVFTVHPSYTGATMIEAGSVQVAAACVKNSSYVSLNTLGTTFTAGFGGDFADIAAVQAETGAASYFRPGGAAPSVSARDNGDGTFTITAVPPSGTVIVIN